MMRLLDIADNQVALVFRRGRLANVLTAGRHVVWGRIKVEWYATTDNVLVRDHSEFVLQHYASLLEAVLQPVETNAHQVALVYRNERLVDIVAPNSIVGYWKTVASLRIDTIDFTEQFRLSEDLLALLGRGLARDLGTKVANALYYSEVPDNQVGLLMVNGKFTETLTAGSYGYWRFGRNVQIKLLDLRVQTMEVSGQEIMTKDRVSLRLNLSANYKVADPEKVALGLKDYVDYCYRQLQLKLREAVGTQTLDALLQDKEAVNASVMQGAKALFADYGIDLISAGLKDIILPGEMKVILNQVVEAEKQAEANLIRRREETQAMRSLHNTAKMMENSAILMRLKELESLERITDRIGNLTVYGGLDSVMSGLVTLANTSQIAKN